MRSVFLKGPRPSYILATMLAIAVAVGFPIYYQGAPLILAAFSGAACGVLGTWFVAYFTHGVLKHMRPSFHAGDLVVVMRGPHTGATGTVKELSNRGRSEVVVELQEKAGVVKFSCHEIEKL